MRLNLVLVVLAVMLGIPVWITRARESREHFTDLQDIPMLFPGFSPDNVALIEIRKRLGEDVIQSQKLPPEQQYETLVFLRDGDKWVLKNSVEFRDLIIDPAAIDRDVLDHIASLRIDHETLVPAAVVDDTFRREQGLTEETGISIRCLRTPQGPELARVLLGKSTKRDAGKSTLDAYHVCRPDHPNEVILYEPRSQEWHMSLRPGDWAQKKIHEFLMSEVESFWFRNELGSAGFRRKKGADDTWLPVPEQCMVGMKPLELDKVGPVEQRKVSELLQHYLVVKAEDFKRAKIKQDEVGALIEVRATMKDGAEYWLWVGEEQPGRPSSVAVSSNHAFQFYIANFFIEAFRRADPKDLFQPR